MERRSYEVCSAWNRLLCERKLNESQGNNDRRDACTKRSSHSCKALTATTTSTLYGLGVRWENGDTGVHVALVNVIRVLDRSRTLTMLAFKRPVFEPPIRMASSRVVSSCSLTRGIRDRKQTEDWIRTGSLAVEVYLHNRMRALYFSLSHRIRIHWKGY